MTRLPPGQFPTLTKQLRRLHRVTGVSAGVALLYLLLTGLPLQFTSLLELERQFISTPAVLDWYALEAPQLVLADNGVAALDDRLYWRQQEIAEARGFLGALSVQDLMVIGTRQALLVFAVSDPTAVERIDFATPLDAIAWHQDRVLVRSGERLLRLDAMLLNAQDVELETETVSWQSPQPLSTAASEPYRQAYRNRLLTAQRLLQDLHSGRAFGSIGVWVINLASILLAGLAITGYWIWWRSRRR